MAEVIRTRGTADTVLSGAEGSTLMNADCRVGLNPRVHFPPTAKASPQSDGGLGTPTTRKGPMHVIPAQAGIHVLLPHAETQSRRGNATADER